MARAQKVKPHFIVFYHDLKHPLREPWNTRTTPYEIWKEYHDDIIFDAPYYSILGYFDTRQEAMTALYKAINFCEENDLPTGDLEKALAVAERREVA